MSVGKLTKVVKRDGRVVAFEKEKIEEAVWKAFQAVGNTDHSTAKTVSNRVVQALEARFDETNLPHVEQIQDLVERQLVDEGLYEVAKAYILYRQRRSDVRETKRMLGVLDDMKLSLNAITVLRSRYLLKDDRGNVVETPRQMLIRVARYLGLVDVFYDPEVYDKDGRQPTSLSEKTDFIPVKVNLNVYELEMMRHLYSLLGKQGRMKVTFEGLLKVLDDRWPRLYEEVVDVFFQVMVNRYFLPNSPTLMNAGAPLGQLSACFVLPVEDSIERIFDAVKWAALIHKSGGGTGFSFSRLRPKGDLVETTKGTASGPISFMRVFDVATEVMKQGGKRRGANMGILRVDHPDVVDFIYAKSRERMLTNFNVSIAITDRFMRALEEGGDYDLVNPRTKKVASRINANSVFDMIVYNAWKTGDPGAIFIDRIQEHNPTPLLGEIESTNPCGEQPLLPFESCNLGSVNLSLMVKKNEKGTYEVDWKKLRGVVRIATHLLDNVIDANKYSLPQVEEMALKTRKIGLGVMGWAEMLFRLGIAYDSKEAADLAEKVMEFISYHSKLESVELAKSRGSFEAFEESIYINEKVKLPFEAEGEERQYALDWGEIRKGIKEHGIRNATTTTVAPTGTISIIAGTSSGIEPLFAISFVREVLGGTKLFETNQVFEEAMREKDIYSEALMREIAKTGSIQLLKEIPQHFKKVFVTALDVSVDYHVKMQSAFQRFTDNAVSKTINLPFEATPEDVRKAYLLAYKLRCKGVTVYRLGSKEEQVLYAGRLSEPRGGLERPKVVELAFDETGGCQKEFCRL